MRPTSFSSLARSLPGRALGLAGLLLLVSGAPAVGWAQPPDEPDEIERAETDAPAGFVAPRPPESATPPDGSLDATDDVPAAPPLETDPPPSEPPPPPPAPQPPPARVDNPSVSEAPVSEESEEQALEGEEATERTLSTANSPPPTAFAIWRSGDSFIKPVLQIGTLLVGYFPQSDVSDSLAMRVSTLALARFGFEGQLFGFLTFRSVFERNLGYSLARNGPVGTSVWEGTASLQARENYLRIDKWGASFTGGIFPDPASLDFVSVNVLDAFGMDPYVRDPLLVSGFGQGQGVMLRYGWKNMLDFGLSFTGGNPLVTSLAFGFAGDVSSLGTLYSAPLRALSNGIPGSEIQLYTLTPSATLDLGVFKLRTAAQLYRVDVDVTSDEDASLRGYNLRATAEVNLLDRMLRVFGGVAYRQNQQLAIPDITMRAGDYEGILFSAGADFTYGDFSVGGMYYFIDSTLSETTNARNQYINVGATYWLHQPNVSIGARWGRSMAESEPTEPRFKTTDSFTLSLRLLI